MANVAVLPDATTFGTLSEQETVVKELSVIDVETVFLLIEPTLTLLPANVSPAFSVATIEKSLFWRIVTEPLLPTTLTTSKPNLLLMSETIWLPEILKSPLNMELRKVTRPVTPEIRPSESAIADSNVTDPVTRLMFKSDRRALVIKKFPTCSPTSTSAPMSIPPEMRTSPVPLDTEIVPEMDDGAQVEVVTAFRSPLTLPRLIPPAMLAPQSVVGPSVMKRRRPPPVILPPLITTAPGPEDESSAVVPESTKDGTFVSMAEPMLAMGPTLTKPFTLLAERPPLTVRFPARSSEPESVALRVPKMRTCPTVASDPPPETRTEPVTEMPLRTHDPPLTVTSEVIGFGAEITPLQLSAAMLENASASAAVKMRKRAIARIRAGYGIEDALIRGRPAWTSPRRANVAQKFGRPPLNIA